MKIFWKIIENKSPKRRDLEEKIRYFPQQGSLLFGKCRWPCIMAMIALLAFGEMIPSWASHIQTDSDTPPSGVSSSRAMGPTLSPNDKKTQTTNDSDKGKSELKNSWQDSKNLAKTTGSPRIGILPSGNVVISWKARWSYQDPWRIVARFYNGDGKPLTDICEVDQFERIKLVQDPYPEEFRMLAQLVPQYAQTSVMAQLIMNDDFCREIDLYKLFPCLERIKLVKASTAEWYDPERGSWTIFEKSASIPKDLFEKQFQVLTSSFYQRTHHLGQEVWETSGSLLPSPRTQITPLYPLGCIYRDGTPLTEVGESYFSLWDNARVTTADVWTLRRCVEQGLTPEKDRWSGRRTYVFIKKGTTPPSTLAGDLSEGRCRVSFALEGEESLVYASTRYERVDPLSGKIILYFRRLNESNPLPSDLTFQESEPLDKKETAASSNDDTLKPSPSETEGEITHNRDPSEESEDLLDKTQGNGNTSIDVSHKKKEDADYFSNFIKSLIQGKQEKPTGNIQEEMDPYHGWVREPFLGDSGWQGWLKNQILDHNERVRIYREAMDEFAQENPYLAAIAQGINDVERLDPITFPETKGEALVTGLSFFSGHLYAKGMKPLRTNPSSGKIPSSGSSSNTLRSNTSKLDSRVNPQIFECFKSKYWNRHIEFKGNKVYQRDDLIDPHLVDKKGRTNLERMRNGLAPYGSDGESMELHHMLQNMDGPIAEVTQTFHQQNKSIIHINPSTISSGIDRPTFDQWRKSYWKERAKDFEK